MQDALHSPEEEAEALGRYAVAAAQGPARAAFVAAAAAAQGPARAGFVAVPAQGPAPAAFVAELVAQGPARAAFEAAAPTAAPAAAQLRANPRICGRDDFLLSAVLHRTETSAR
jgi:hypothetical protein